MMWLSDGKKFEDMITRFDSIQEHDRRTGRQTPRDGTATLDP